MLGRGIEKAADLAAARKMLAGGPQHDDADARIGVERLEHGAQLLALGHRDDVERRPVEDHIGALPLGIDLEAEAVETIGERRQQRRGSLIYSLRYSPATSSRRKILPTGDFGISATNTYSRGRL